MQNIYFTNLNRRENVGLEYKNEKHRIKNIRRMSLFWLVVSFVCSVLVIILHIIALSLLIKVNLVNLSGSQRYLLIFLCLTELGFGMSFFLDNFPVLDIIHKQLFIFEATPLYFMYLSIMVILTLDRFLEFRFNIKYFIIWSSRKTVIILSLCLCFSLIIFICLLPFSTEVYSYKKYWIAYIYGPIACFYCLLASLTYYHIFKKIKENRKQSHELKKHITKDQLNQLAQNKKRTQVFLPSFIILTFILFNIFPILLIVLNDFVFPEVEWLGGLLTVLFELGWMADPLIYIFTLKSIRRKIQHGFTTFKKAKSNDTIFTQSKEYTKNTIEDMTVASDAM